MDFVLVENIIIYNFFICEWRYRVFVICLVFFLGRCVRVVEFSVRIVDVNNVEFLWSLVIVWSDGFKIDYWGWIYF